MAYKNIIFLNASINKTCLGLKTTCIGAGFTARFSYESESGEYVLSTNYSIICQNDTEADCEAAEITVKPQFAVTIYDFYENVLHDTFLHHADQFQVQKQPMNFDPDDYPLFVVNMRFSGNFIVKYPESVYNAFISKLLELEEAGITDTDQLYSIDKRLAFFALHMLKLSKMNKVRMTYMFKLISIAHAWQRLMREEESTYYNVFNFYLTETKTCLNGAFLTHVKENDPNTDNFEIVRKFSCRMDKKDDDCQYEMVNVTKLPVWRKWCEIWAQKWNGKMQVYLKEFNQEAGYED